MWVLSPTAAQTSDRSRTVETSGDAEWIWSAEFPRDEAPEGDVYFRKSFDVRNPEGGQIRIACDDNYELFVNGRLVGEGNDWRKLDSYDIARYLVSGRNVVAVRATNVEPGSAGLVAVVSVRGEGNTDVAYSTDRTWKSGSKMFLGWQTRRFSDRNWTASTSFGEYGRTTPWSDETQVAGGSAHGRFMIAPDFRIQRVVTPDEIGAAIAMTFDERGQLIVSREGGSLAIVRDEDGDGIVETVSAFSDRIKNAQGLLALNGDVYATGDGPEGTGFYRLSDDDEDGQAEGADLLFAIEGSMGEHGPHAVVLGPDGLIYLAIGNHAGLQSEVEPTSPHQNFYEGDLVGPRYEDAGGHAVGIKAPGGTIIRTDAEGKFVERVAGGLRNAYDVAFNRQGELFTYDSDMEWDEGLPWYRPTRINHVTAGAEFGWRSGWAKWPEYYVDSLPAVIDTGRGSPTGVTLYDHYRFPARFHDALFVGDWSMGRILAVKLRRKGASYEAQTREFLVGRPLNVTDLEVGPDGWLYFSTGGRGTEGGVYRIVWNGRVPPQPPLEGVMQAIRQPQVTSSWGRDRVAQVKEELGDAVWTRQLTTVASGDRYSAHDRVGALDLMQLFGPFPTSELLVRLAADGEATVRSKAAYLMGIHVDDTTGAQLERSLDDPDPMVRRIACESIVRSEHVGPAERLVEMMAEDDRFVAWAARRALERVPTDEWRTRVVEHRDCRVFTRGAVALLMLEDERATIDAILGGVSEFLQVNLPEDDTVAVLRVAQLALGRGELTAESVPGLELQLAAKYPTNNHAVNRELVRLLVYLQNDGLAEKMLAELDADVPNEEKMHVAAHARFLKTGWTADMKLDLLEYYEIARQQKGGFSASRYVDNFVRDFFGEMTAGEKQLVLENGAQLPTAALHALGTVAESPSPELLARLMQMDQRLQETESESAGRLRTGIAAVLGQSHEAVAMAYLRELYENEPERRAELAMAIAQAPDGENWSMLVQSLAVVEGVAAQEVLTKLATVDRAADDPDSLRQVILSGLRLGENGGQQAVALLQQWTGTQLTNQDDTVSDALAAWQHWYAGMYPDALPAELPVEAEGAKWTYDELLTFLKSEDGQQGDMHRGALVFEKAQCQKCHRMGDRGEGFGPDLTTVARRFQKKEILESIMFPSQVISDQYASKTVVTDDGLTVTGLVGAAGADAVVVLDSRGEKRTIPSNAIEQIAPARMSAMPDGLLDGLELEEIADLFDYLTTPETVTRRPLRPSNSEPQ
jgi:putative heme-binding domain-containing protein